MVRHRLLSSYSHHMPPGECRRADRGSLQVLDVARGNVIGRVGVQAQVPVVGMAKPAFELGAVVPGRLRELERERVSQIMRAKRAEPAVGASNL
jgi:hypothetical protein